MGTSRKRTAEDRCGAAKWMRRKGRDEGQARNSIVPQVPRVPRYLAVISLGRNLVMELACPCDVERYSHSNHERGTTFISDLCCDFLDFFGLSLSLVGCGS